MPSDTRPTQFGSQPDHLVDPELLRQLNAKRDVLVNAYDQIAQALRFAAKACDEFQSLIPRDVGIVPSDSHMSGSGHPLHQSRKFKKSQIKDPNAPKRPNTAYILFSNEIRAETKADNPNANQKEIVTLIGQKWKALSREQKKVYEDRYFADKERYDEELRVYRATHGHVESPPETSSNEDNGDHGAASAKLVSNAPNVYVPNLGPISATSVGAIQGDVSTMPISVPPSETENSALFESFIGAFPSGEQQDAFAAALATSVEAISGSSSNLNKRTSPEIDPADVSKNDDEAPAAKRTRASSKKANEEDVFNPPADDLGTNAEQNDSATTTKRTRTKRGAAANGSASTAQSKTASAATTRSRRGGNA
ncbi:Non-histone chromosomal protein 6 [Gigaspora margarita]|uniref:Non-histone chromosomal protein 6 n=2 Tax=Gigaspora TaxID=4873 RepID=A0A8H3WX55_GIGMA|nr:Non-histone chromosomal protein 6 [Gigaspora margarita]